MGRPKKKNLVKKAAKMIFQADQLQSGMSEMDFEELFSTYDKAMLLVAKSSLSEEEKDIVNCLILLGVQPILCNMINALQEDDACDTSSDT